MKKHLLSKVAALFLILCVVCLNIATAVSAVDDNNGSITINIDTKAEGVTMSLYDVGSYSYTTGKIQLEGEFAECAVSSETLPDASTALMVATELNQYAVDNFLLGTDVYADEHGKAQFTNLNVDNRVYLIAQSTLLGEITIDPIVVVLPYQYKGDEPATTQVNIDAKSVVHDMDYKGALILTKTDAKNAPLSGAEFKFERKVYYSTEPESAKDAEKGSDAKGNYYWKTVAENLVSDANGQVVATQLPLDTFRFIETKAPAGYILNPTPMEFTVEKYATVKLENNRYVADSGEPVYRTWINEEEPSESSPESSEPPFESSTESSTDSSIISEPPSEPSTPSTPPDVQITGDDIARYIIIGSIVLASLVVVILLVVLTGKKKKK